MEDDKRKSMGIIEDHIRAWQERGMSKPAKNSSNYSGKVVRPSRSRIPCHNSHKRITQ